MNLVSKANPLHNSGFRPEIQGLRAVAVVLVMVYHVWPHVLPGGYIGVDAFFVISGYLITGLLFKEYSKQGSISLSNFYIRRIKRLLPAATLVLLVVTACIPLLPDVRWENTATGVSASALYIQNWWLAGQAVDYLAAEEAPSILKHYWSLSLEEQYYFAWPLMVMVTAFFVPRAIGRPRLIFCALILGVIASSLVYSIWVTTASPGLAYFSTFTRAYELGLGGLLAVTLGWRSLSVVVRDALGWLGVALLLIAALAFDGNTAFPGYAALLPTLGAASVIIAGSSDRAFSAYSLLRTRPFQYLGDISYSLYLWHWPVIVLYGEISGREMSFLDGLIVSGVSCALAHQTKELVEDYFRRSDRLSRPAWAPFCFAGLSIVISITAARMMVSRQMPSEEQLVAKTDLAQQIENTTTPNSIKLVGLRNGRLTMSPVAARSDNPEIYGNGCHLNQEATEPLNCEYGDRDSGFHIVLTGDSHAAQWLPPLQEVVRKNGWKLTSFTKSACPFSEAVVTRRGRPYKSCTEWNHRALQLILEMRPTIIVTSQSRGQNAYTSENLEGNREILSEGLSRRWQALSRAGISVVAIADTPRMEVDVPDCLSSARGGFGACATPLETTHQKPDPIRLAVERTPSVQLLDLNGHLCDEIGCPPAKDGIIVWRDRDHLTATFARSLAPHIESALVRALESRPFRQVATKNPSSDLSEPFSAIGELTCGSVGSLDPFRRASKVTFKQGEFVMASGSVADFLVKRQQDGQVPDKFNKRFEWWQGIIDGDRATVTGWYNEGSPDIKSIAFDGNVVGDTIRVAGWRGPRQCVFEVTLNAAVSG